MADGQHWRDMPVPRLRLTTFGAFQISLWRNGAWEAVTHKDLSVRGPTVTFLKVLVSSGPLMDSHKRSLRQGEWERHEASRDVLIDALWPEEGTAPADPENGLSGAKSVINRVLRPYSGDDVVMLTDGSDKVGYAFNSHALIIDADEFEGSVLQASEAEGRGEREQALTLWEHAYSLVQGEFLPHDRYNDWSVERRERLHGKYHLCLHRLTALYLEQGRTTEVVEKVHPHVLAHPTDVDALCVLLPLFAQQGRYEEALQLATACQRLLQEDGEASSSAITSIEQWLREAQEAALVYLSRSAFALASHTRILSYEALLMPDGQARSEGLTPPLSEDIRRGREEFFPSSELLDLTVEGLFEVGTRAALLAGQKECLSIEEIRARIDHAFRNATAMEQQKQGTFSRREVLFLLTSLPGALLGLERAGSAELLLTEETVSLCLVAIPACWRLVYTGGIQHVEKVLPDYLPHLTTLARQSTRHRTLIASVASQGYKLANLLDLRREDFVAALQHSRKALLYGQLAEDPNLQVAALTEEALTYWYRRRPSQTLAAYQHALGLIREVSPILKGRVYVGLGEAYAQLGQEQEALRYMGLAHDTFPDHPENDPNFSYTHYSHYYLYLYEGLMYTKLNQPEHALAAYAHFDAPVYAAHCTEIANREAAAWLTMGDLDRCSAKVETAATLAIAGESDLRYSEAREIYQGMLIKWPHEQKVKSLAHLFQR